MSSCFFTLSSKTSFNTTIPSDNNIPIAAAIIVFFLISGDDGFFDSCAFSNIFTLSSFVISFISSKASSLTEFAISAALLASVSSTVIVNILVS